MKNFKMILVAATVFTLALVGFAIAQGVDPTLPPGDPQTWFANPIALGTVVKFAVDLIRKHLLKNLDGAAVLGLAAVLAGLLTGVGVALHFITTDPFAFAFGTLTAAVGLNKLADQIGGKNAKAQSPTVDPATRSRIGL